MANSFSGIPKSKIICSVGRYANSWIFCKNIIFQIKFPKSVYGYPTVYKIGLMKKQFRLSGHRSLLVATYKVALSACRCRVQILKLKSHYRLNKYNGVVRAG